MRAITLTKKQLKRVGAVAAAAAATAAVVITAVVTSAGGRADQRRLPIYCVECEEKKVAVTFDVAWENSNTSALIEILERSGAKATFFVTGDWCDRYPDDVKAFYDAGHSIENHSDQHPHVEGININDLINDTKECSRKIKMITGEEPTLYRAPYGEFDDNLLTTIEGLGMKTIQWDVDSVDWKKPSPDDIKKKVLKNVKNGSILLFHNDLENTTAALPEILSTLKSQGYSFVTVDELIYKDNYTIDAAGKQIPVSKSAIDLSDENIQQVMAQYSDVIAAAGITEAQIAEAVSAIRNNKIDSLPAELQPFAMEVLARLTNGADVPDLPGSSNSSNSADNSGSSVVIQPK
ncbi:MAG: polysaccharide deacetylase family protein [Oscillospiraceae bacterium]|nr:polysaccharide deacetylase family protein [Oscillospiraceae bacterium]